MIRRGSRRRQVFSHLAVLILAGCGGAAEPRPDTRPTPIMFESVRGGQGGLFLMSVDGKRVVPFTAAGEGARTGDWSPTGSLIVFTRMYPTMQVWIANVDGTELRQLTSSSGMSDLPRWMPDGGRISYANNDDPFNWGINAVNLDGSGAHRIPNTLKARGPHSWSPDGRRLVYELWDAVPIPGETDFQPVLSLFVADTTAAAPVRLTTNTDCGDSYPEWSPDGTKIAFASCANNRSAIVVIAPDGTGRVALTDGQAVDAHPTWSADGTHIVFERRTGTTADVWMMSADGTNQVNLTAANLSFDGAPVWRRALTQLR